MKRRLVTRCALVVLAAFALFAFLFLRAGAYFWAWLACSAIMLSGAAFLAEAGEMRATLGPAGARSGVKTLLLGFGSAALLYGIFFLGNLVARVLFPFGADEIESVYRLGPETPRWVVAVLLICVVGPGEEIFWRGYVQRRLSLEFGWAGTVASVLAYCAVHIATGNLTLVLAALVCGAFWALLYRRYDSLWINIVSHGAWAAAIFVLFPMATGGL
jgi:uncharacterized protein